jgi:NAD-dependent dihydropyrimidine dehydrogenase PreA subunit
MAITAIDDELCNGCGICIDTCPADVLRLVEPALPWTTSGWKARAVYPSDCHSCTLCALDCPQGAIRVSYRVAVAPEVFPYPLPAISGQPSAVGP